MKKLVSLLFVFLLIGCSNNNSSSSSYTDIHSYEEVKDITITYDKVFSISETDHYIYYYNETCYNCQILKDDVISFALDKKAEIYFVLTTNDTPHNYEYTDINQTIGLTGVDNVYCNVTPQLAFLSSNRIAKNMYGNEFIKREISSYY